MCFPALDEIFIILIKMDVDCSFVFRAEWWLVGMV